MIDVASDCYRCSYPGANDSGDFEDTIESFVSVTDGVSDLHMLGRFGRHVVDLDVTGFARGSGSRTGLDLANAPQPRVHADAV